jgi:DNA polymerase (family 10)
VENLSIAQIFWDIAALLEFDEENPFRIRAYQRAAQNIESLSENLETKYTRGGTTELKKIPGIGEDLSLKIEEILKTGKLKFYNDLLRKFPRGVLDLLKVKGIGPKFATMVYKEFRVKSVAGLEKLIKAGKLKGKKIENILKGIEAYKRQKDIFTLGEALPLAEAIVEKLKELKEFPPKADPPPAEKNILICGSLRRWKEVIGDIDILAASDKPQIIMDAFVKLPGVKRILAKGLTKSSVVLENEMQSDLRVVKPESFGAAAHYFTGSKQHNIRLREMAVKKGLKVSEYGVFKGKKMIAGKTEEEVYKALGLAYVPPELRENRGEIEAAKNNQLPKLIELNDIRGDLHMHTKDSDGSNTIEEMALAAKKLGYEYIAITNHSYASHIAHGLSEEKLINHLKEIDRANKKIKGITILKGIEVDILGDGKIDFKDAILKNLEVVIASVHSGFSMPKEKITARIMRAMENKYVNIIGHVSGRLLGKREAYELDYEKILKAARDSGTFMELNAYPDRLDLDDIRCRAAKEMGILIMIGSDAHNLDQLRLMRYGVHTARRGWLKAEDVLNTYPLDKLMKKLYYKRK